MAITIFADRTSQCPLPADTDREGRGLADSLPGVVKLGPLVVVTGPSGPACVATRAPSWPASVRLPPSVDLRFSAFAEADDLRRLSPPVAALASFDNSLPHQLTSTLENCDGG